MRHLWFSRHSRATWGHSCARGIHSGVVMGISGVKLPRSRTQIFPITYHGLRESHLTSPNLSFFTCRMAIIIASNSEGWCEDYMSSCYWSMRGKAWHWINTQWMLAVKSFCLPPLLIRSELLKLLACEMLILALDHTLFHSSPTIEAILISLRLLNMA